MMGHFSLGENICTYGIQKWRLSVAHIVVEGYSQCPENMVGVAGLFKRASVLYNPHHMRQDVSCSVTRYHIYLSSPDSEGCLNCNR